MKLYEITDSYNSIAELDPEGDENFQEALNNSLAEIHDEFETKAVNVLKVAKNFKAEANAIDAEIKKMQARKKTLLAKDESLRDYLKTNMLATGIKRITCPFFDISTRNTKASVVIDSAVDVPDEYKETVVTEKIDKNAIYNDIKDGVSVEGAHLQDNVALFIK